MPPTTDRARPLSIDDRLLIAAALDRILYDDPERFAAADAALVRRLIPPARTSWLRLGFRAETRGPRFGGAAAGVGQVDLEDEKKVIERGVGEGPLWRCGQYKITNHGSDLEVWQVMSDEFAEEPKGARLEFGPLGEPQALSFFQPRDIQLRIPFTDYAIGVRLGGWQGWKRAA